MTDAFRHMQIVLALVLALWADISSAHGLQMTTAQVVQRQDNYLFITISTSLTKLYQQIAYGGKPESMIHLANGPDKQVEQFRSALLSLFESQLILSVADKRLQSMRVKTLGTVELKKLLQAEVAEHVLSAMPGHGDHHSDRKNYLRIEVDGFLPQTDAPRVLNGSFPKELGQILVSYSKPQIQTISPSDSGSVYIQELIK